MGRQFCPSLFRVQHKCGLPSDQFEVDVRLVCFLRHSKLETYPGGGHLRIAVGTIFVKANWELPARLLSDQFSPGCAGGRALRSDRRSARCLKNKNMAH